MRKKFLDVKCDKTMHGSNLNTHVYIKKVLKCQTFTMFSNILFISVFVFAKYSCLIQAYFTIKLENSFSLVRCILGIVQNQRFLHFVVHFM